MFGRATAHVLATLGLGAVFVATPLPINFAALVLWAVLVARWVKRRARASGRRSGAAELALQLGVLSALVMIADAAPGKVVDRVKARRITLPRQTMTIGELREPEDHRMDPPLYHPDSGLGRRFRYYVSTPDGLTDRSVRFPSRELTVGQFIASIEAQTPLRHRFSHCGNGYTILAGGDCSFGLSFGVPPQ